MSCIGKDCFIARQQARDPNPIVSIEGEYTGEQLARLEAAAKQKILDAATETNDTCGDGCRCVARPGAQPEETAWEPEPIVPFTLTEGECRFKVTGGGVMTRVVRTPGVCKKARIVVTSVAFLEPGIEVAALDPARLSAISIAALQKALTPKSTRES